LGNTPSNTSVKNDQHTIHSRTNPALLDWTLYLSAATLIAGFGFLMQMFITGAATKFRLEHAESGVAIFSRIMLINTVMCTALNVFASRLFKRPAIAMPLGIALMGLGGTLVFLNGSGTPEKYLFGAFLLTLGELSFAAVSQLLVMRLVPKVKNQASVFSVGVFIQTGGSMLGASSALLFIQSHNAGWCFAAAAMAILIAQLGITRLIERLKPDCI
jgi:MFS family permease